MEKQKTTNNIDLLRCISGGSPADSNTVNKFGYNADVDTGASEDIWTFGGLYPYGTFSTAQTLEIVSNSGNDVIAGTGARTMTIKGLGADLEEKAETITLTGASAVVLSGTWSAVNRMFIETTGTGGVNAGTINCQVSSAGQVVSQIAVRTAISAITIGKGQTEQAVYRVPAGKVGQIKTIKSTTEDATATQVALEIMQVSTDCQTIKTKGSFFMTELTPLTRNYAVGGITYTAGQWAIMRAVEVSSGNVAISGEFDMVLEKV